MKKIVFSIIAIVIIAQIALIGYYLFKNNGTLPNFINYDQILQRLKNSEISPTAIDKDIAMIQDILAASENNELNNEELDLEDLDLSDIKPNLENLNQENTTLGSRVVPQIFKIQQTFENAFIRFSHPNYISVINKNISFLEIYNNETLVGTLNIYSNPEKLSLENFVKKDNIVDYYLESSKLGILTEEFKVPTVSKGVVFRQYPGTKEADIYLLDMDGFIVVASDFSEDKIIGEYLLRSIEKTR